MNDLLSTIIIGIGATVFMDLWVIIRKMLFNIAAPNYALLGRWLLHMRHGQFYQKSINTAPSVRGERVFGWLSHYLIGITFAVVLLSFVGRSWLNTPTILPALITGTLTVVAPFLLMQPGMGAGIAASRTPKPNTARFQSLLTHVIFGFGLYFSACILRFFLKDFCVM